VSAALALTDSDCIVLAFPRAGITCRRDKGSQHCPSLRWQASENLHLWNPFATGKSVGATLFCHAVRPLSSASQGYTFNSTKKAELPTCCHKLGENCNACGMEETTFWHVDLCCFKNHWLRWLPYQWSKGADAPHNCKTNMLKLRTASKRSFQPLAGIGGLGFSPALANKKKWERQNTFSQFCTQLTQCSLIVWKLIIYKQQPWDSTDKHSTKSNRQGAGLSTSSRMMLPTPGRSNSYAPGDDD